MKRTLTKLLLVTCLCIASSGMHVLGASAATESNVVMDGLECPTPSAPYGISQECAHAISVQSVRDAIRFNNLAQTETSPLPTPSMLGWSGSYTAAHALALAPQSL